MRIRNKRAKKKEFSPTKLFIIFKYTKQHMRVEKWN